MLEKKKQEEATKMKFQRIQQALELNRRTEKPCQRRRIEHNSAKKTQNSRRTSQLKAPPNPYNSKQLQNLDMDDNNPTENNTK